MTRTVARAQTALIAVVIAGLASVGCSAAAPPPARPLPVAAGPDPMAPPTRYESGSVYVNTPGVGMHTEVADEQMLRTVARCYEAEPFEADGDVAAINMGLRIDREGLHVQVVHRQQRMDTAFGDCIEQRMQDWFVATHPEPGEWTVPMNIGWLDGAGVGGP